MKDEPENSSERELFMAVKGVGGLGEKVQVGW